MSPSAPPRQTSDGSKSARVFVSGQTSRRVETKSSSSERHCLLYKHSMEFEPSSDVCARYCVLILSWEVTVSLGLRVVGSNREFICTCAQKRKTKPTLSYGTLK